MVTNKLPLELSAALHMPPNDAIAFFKSKGYAFTFNWQQLWQEAHARAFTVADVTRADILRDIRNAIQDALGQGQTQKWFRQQLEPILRRKGWWGLKEEINPDTGEVRQVKMGCPERLRLIYNQNIQGAYMAGRYKQMKANTAFRPYWQYICKMLPTSRAGHRALHLLVFPHDDPFWETHYTPNGYGCQCKVRSLSRARLMLEGLAVQKSAGRMVTREVPVYDRHAGVRRMRTVTGYTLPNGAVAWTDVGFSANNAARWAGGMDGPMAAKLGDIRRAVPEIFRQTKKALDTSPAMLLAYRQAVAEVLDTRRTQNINIYVGTFAPEITDALHALGVNAPDVLVFPDTRIAHANSKKHQAAGIAPSREQFLSIPKYLRHVEWLYWNNDKKTPSFVIPDSDPEWRLIIPVELPANAERKADGLGVIVNAYRKKAKELHQSGHLRPILQKNEPQGRDSNPLSTV